MRHGQMQYYCAGKKYVGLLSIYNKGQLLEWYLSGKWI